VPWSALATRLDDAPVIVAGPILRQVTETAVTVWLALKVPADVTLAIYDRDSGAGRVKLGEGKRKTTAIGRNLHIVAVTSHPTSALTGGKMTEGRVYFYDLTFNGPPGSPSLVGAMTRHDRLEEPDRIAYPPFTLPSFALPPADLNRLRLIQGSCRKPNGGQKDDPADQEPPDALGMLDQLIADTVADPFARPHQLLLTGDQIYADEVADVLLAMLTDAGDTLLGWPELMPAGLGESGAAFGPYEAAKLPPTTRTDAIRNARFTTEDTRSHLMSLGEYFAMYLFAWSEELWIDPPTVAELKTLNPGLVLDAEVETDAERQRKSVVTYRATIAQVRRALANVPSYMICDDHEITDDWNMTRRFCEKVYGTPLGSRIIQNGLIAFAVCQAWGNTPEQFADGTQAAGARLLKSVEAVSQVEVGGTHVYHAFDAELSQRVGLHDAATLAAKGAPYGVFHDLEPFAVVNGMRVSTVSLEYNFTVEGPGHQVIVTDTRTWRSFPDPGLESHPELLGADALKRQVAEAPPLGNRLLLVVVTTNAPPTAGIREAAFIGAAANYYVGKKAGALYLKSKDFLYNHDLNDSWEFPSLAFDHLLVAISDKFHTVDGRRTGRAVFLSGDVHFSFASRLAYWADVQRLGDPPGQGQKVTAVFAQLVASAFKNEKGDTRGLQRVGYGYTPKDWQAHVSWSHEPTGYVGWNMAAAAGARKVGRIKPGVLRSGNTFKVDGRQPTLVAQLLAGGNDVTLDVKPDYRYRLDYLATSTTGQTIDPSSTVGQIVLANRPAAAQSYANASRAHRDLVNKGATLPEVIGFNNLSEISFLWQHADGTPATTVDDPLTTNRRVRHTLRWQQPGTGITPYWATYDVSLNVDDPGFRPIPADDEP
jgi:hypothetical protein